MSLVRNAPLVAALVCAAGAPAVAQCPFDSGSDGSDGVLDVSTNTVIDLSLATTGHWTDAGDGNGVYDPEQWLVVFKYESVNLASGTVSFVSHPSGAPVAWLVQGDVLISASGRVDVSAEPHTFGHAYELPTPGPGGFAGGGGQRDGGAYPRGAGAGPGGGLSGEAPGQYAGSYGNAQIFPMIGGSGGAGRQSYSAGSGGGAILIAANGTIDVQGGIEAIGTESCCYIPSGSGGAIRLVATTVTGTGFLRAYGENNGPDGRIRIEGCDHAGYTGAADPVETRGAPGQVMRDDTTPALLVTHVNGVPVPEDPRAGVLTKDIVTDSNELLVEIAARNVPPGTIVTALIAPVHGDGFTVMSTPLEGTLDLSTATLEFVLSTSFPAELQLKASW